MPLCTAEPEFVIKRETKLISDINIIWVLFNFSILNIDEYGFKYQIGNNYYHQI